MKEDKWVKVLFIVASVTMFGSIIYFCLTMPSEIRSGIYSKLSAINGELAENNRILLNTNNKLSRDIELMLFIQQERLTNDLYSGPHTVKEEFQINSEDQGKNFITFE